MLSRTWRSRQTIAWDLAAGNFDPDSSGKRRTAHPAYPPLIHKPSDSLAARGQRRKMAASGPSTCAGVAHYMRGNAPRKPAGMAPGGSHVCHALQQQQSRSLDLAATLSRRLAAPAETRSHPADGRQIALVPGTVPPALTSRPFPVPFTDMAKSLIAGSGHGFMMAATNPSACEGSHANSEATFLARWRDSPVGGIYVRHALSQQQPRPLDAAAPAPRRIVALPHARSDPANGTGTRHPAAPVPARLNRPAARAGSEERPGRVRRSRRRPPPSCGASGGARYRRRAAPGGAWRYCPRSRDRPRSRCGGW